MDIGSRIKSLRIKNNLTLEELASRTELTKGFLSQLENNLTSPSITTLEDITQVLGISLDKFFKEEKEIQCCFKERDLFTDERDGSSITYLVPNSAMNDMEPILLALKKDGVSDVIRPHDSEEFGYVLQGKVILKNLTNKESYYLKKGETFYLKGEFKHQLVNNYDGTSKIIWISSPSVF